MSDKKPDADRKALLADFHNGAVRTYLFVGLGALLVLLLAMLQRGASVGALLATVVGVAGLLAQWRTAPPVLFGVVSVSLFEWGRGRAFHVDDPFDLGDMLLCGAMVAYLGAPGDIVSVR